MSTKEDPESLTTVTPERLEDEQAPVVELRGVRKAFGETKALSEASLRGGRGEIHAIVGENGSGKSTLIKVLAGVHPADVGEVLVDGEPVSGANPARMQERGIAAVFQEVLIADGASLLDNVFLGYDGLFRQKLPHRKKVAVACDLLNRLFGRTVDVDVPAGSLPLSERQLVTVARALVRDPKVLILDESTSALDLRGSTAVMTELEHLKQRGGCILLVTHRISELKVLADQATVLRDGVTVGLLSRAEFSEERMLKMMSGREVESEAKVRGEVRSPSVSTGTPMIVCEDVRLRPDSVPFSIELHEGETIGLAGLEGNGQEALIRALAGIGPIAGGEISSVEDGEIHSYSSGREAERLGLAYVSGDRKADGVFPDLSILDNFAMPAYRRNSRFGLIDWGAVRQLFRRYRERLNIRMTREGLPVTSLSGGNQQKVLLARWLALDPRVLILHDPTRGVDVATKHDLYEALHELTVVQRKGAVLLSTEIDELVGVCDRILVFREHTLSAELGRSENIDGVLAAMFGAKELGTVLAAEARSIEEADEGNSGEARA